MSELLDKLGISIIKTQEQSMDLIEKLIATARPNAVFGQPVSAGDYTVITAAEVSCGLGTGFGGGGGSGPAKSDEEVPSEGKSPTETEPANGYGVGGGGGGFSTARPVAAISIGPDGVHVEPIVDATKVALAFFTTLGAMALMCNRMCKMGRKQ
jgi:uncharacterized spore protein YtfJ